MTNIVRAWHFLYEGNKLRNGETAPDDGEWLEVDGKIKLCSWGLHASLDAFDALIYAPGPILCLVEYEGEVVYGHDKIVGRKRRIVARMDATDMLRYYARMQAISVLHLWNPPDIVIEYLMGEDAARAAAWDAAWDPWGAEWAARDATRDAAWAAARDAAWAALGAERATARATARADFNQLVQECFVDYL